MVKPSEVEVINGGKKVLDISFAVPLLTSWPSLDVWVFVKEKETKKLRVGNSQAGLAQHVPCTVNPRILDPEHQGGRDRKQGWGEKGKFGSRQVGSRHIGLYSALRLRVVFLWPRL